MQAYMKSEMPFLGVHNPARTALAREIFTPLDFATGLTLWREPLPNAGRNRGAS